MGNPQVLRKKETEVFGGGTELCMHSDPGWDKLPMLHVHTALHSTQSLKCQRPGVWLPGWL